jgi:hypothetical protein
MAATGKYHRRGAEVAEKKVYSVLLSLPFLRCHGSIGQILVDEFVAEEFLFLLTRNRRPRQEIKPDAEGP